MHEKAPFFRANSASASARVTPNATAQGRLLAVVFGHNPSLPITLDRKGDDAHPEG